MSVFDSQDITIPCAKCGAKHEKSVVWLNANDEFACSCGMIINLDHGDFLRQLWEIDRELESVPRNIAIKL